MSAKPRTLKYAEALQAVEQRVVDALPEIIDGLIDRAKDGDTKAAVYLCDRILGRTAGAKVAPADDREPPYTEAAFELDREEREEDNDMRRLLRRKRGKARSVVQWGSSIATADPTFTDPSGGAVESLRNTWRGGKDALLIAALEADERDWRAIRPAAATERAEGTRRPGASPRRTGRASPRPRPRRPERGGVSSAPSGRMEETSCLKTS